MSYINNNSINKPKMSIALQRAITWKSLFDHIYVLNLKKSEDRRIHIKNEFQKVSIIDYEFFEAITPEGNEVPNIKKSGLVKLFPPCFRCNQIRCNCENNYLTDFQLANWCSFIKIFNDIVQKKYKFVLICEDDIVFTPNSLNTIFTLLSKKSKNFYKIDMNKPLLIGMGGAYHQNKHFSNEIPHFRNYLCMSNPCFAINYQMAEILINNIIIQHTSDHYIHLEIPKKYPNIQHFIMHPWPVYELSFVPSVMKFESLVRPNGISRKMKYIDIYFEYKNQLYEIINKLLIEKYGLIKNRNYISNNLNEKNEYFYSKKIFLNYNLKDDIFITFISIILNKNLNNIYDLSSINNLSLQNNENKENIINFLINDFTKQYILNILNYCKKYNETGSEFIFLDEKIENLNKNQKIENLIETMNCIFHKNYNIDFFKKHIDFFSKNIENIINNFIKNHDLIIDHQKWTLNIKTIIDDIILNENINENHLFNIYKKINI